MPRGGKREGAGRPKGSNAARKFVGLGPLMKGKEMRTPQNETETILLFNWLNQLYKLGFTLVYFSGSFPDAVYKYKNKEIKVEFELKSSRAKHHFDDPTSKSTLCEMIICWQHDWAECPVDVFEIKKVIDFLNVNDYEFDVIEQIFKNRS